MSDAQVAAVDAFVRGGGGVVATGRTSLYDAWYGQRPDLGLRAVLGPDVTLDSGDIWRAASTGLATGESFARHGTGAGRGAFFPRIETPGAPQYEGVLGELPYRFPTEQWQVPTTMPDFLEAVAWARGGVAPLVVDAPEGVAVDLQTGAEGAVIVHLVDYDVGRSEPATVKVSVRVPGAQVASVLPLGEDPAPVSFEADGDVVRVDITLDVYAALVFS